MINFSFDCLLDMSYTHHYLGNLKHRYLFVLYFRKPIFQNAQLGNQNVSTTRMFTN